MLLGDASSRCFKRTTELVVLIRIRVSEQVCYATAFKSFWLEKLNLAKLKSNWSNSKSLNLWHSSDSSEQWRQWFILICRLRSDSLQIRLNLFGFSRVNQRVSTPALWIWSSQVASLSNIQDFKISETSERFCLRRSSWKYLLIQKSWSIRWISSNVCHFINHWKVVFPESWGCDRVCWRDFGRLSLPEFIRQLANCLPGEFCQS